MSDTDLATARSFMDALRGKEQTSTIVAALMGAGVGAHDVLVVMFGRRPLLTVPAPDGLMGA